MEYLWAKHPDALLYTVDTFGMSKLFFGPAYIHHMSKTFVPIGQQKEPITCGLTDTRNADGLKMPSPLLKPEEAEQLLKACVAPSIRPMQGAGPGYEEYSKVAELGKSMELRTGDGYGRLPT